MQNSRKRERERELPGHTCVATWPSRSSPAHQGQRRLPPHASRMKGVCPTHACPTRACTHRPPPACLLAAERLWETPRNLLTPVTLPCGPPLLCSRSLFRSRAEPSPPFVVATATASPSTPRRACELRLDEPRGPGCATTQPPLLFPSSATGDHHRRFAASCASPSPLRRLLHPM